MLCALLALGTSLPLAACGDTTRRHVRPTEDFYQPNPSVRMAAVAAARRSGDMSSVPILIELLDDSDEAVRLAAGRALQDLTGRDTGYAAWAPADERRAQVVAWRAWWATQAEAAGAAELGP
ncbi:MAG: HEAT repeat domain-containing protein [Planctomycetota bacterium]